MRAAGRDPGFDCMLTAGKRDSPKFGHEMRDFFASLSGIREIVMTQINVLEAKPSYRVFLVSGFLIEIVKEYFVSTRRQKSPHGVSIPVIDSMLNWRIYSVRSLFTG